LNLKVHEWLVNSFTVNVAETDTECEEELLELKYDEESKLTLNNDGDINMWQNKIKSLNYIRICGK
jgi:hypothetical protein